MELKLGDLTEKRDSTWLEMKWASVWEDNFTQLLHYKREFGHCNVPQDWPPNIKLANWANAQRQANGNGSLSTERFGRLDELGFVWNRREEVWNQMFEGLMNYKLEHGDCKVPRDYENAKLANWVGAQRQFKQHGSLSEERIQKLDEVGFSWSEGGRETTHPD